MTNDTEAHLPSLQRTTQPARRERRTPLAPVPRKSDRRLMPCSATHGNGSVESSVIPHLQFTPFRINLVIVGEEHLPLLPGRRRPHKRVPNGEGQVPQVPVPGKTRPSAEGGLQPVKSSPPRGRVPKVHVPLHRLIANVPSPAHPALPATFPSRRRKTACEGTGTSGTCPQGKPDFRPMPGSSHKN